MDKVNLGDILSTKRGMSLPGANYAEEGNLIRLTLGNFDYPSGGFKENTSKKDIYYVGEVAPEFILNEGDVITPLTEQVAGLLGETARIPQSGVYVQSGDVALLNPVDGKLDKSFMAYLIASPLVKKQLGAAAQQTKIRHTSPDAIENCIVWIPDLHQQKKIGYLLDLVNDKIANNKEIIKELESTARLIYGYWFNQFDFPDANGKPYRSNGGKMVWSKELKREIPEGWQSTRVGDITRCFDSQRIPLSSQERNKIKPGEIPYYGATGIMDYVNEYIFDGDYVLVAEDGSVMDDAGLPIIQRVSGKAWINNHAHVLEPSKGHCCRLLMMILKDIPVMKIKTGSIQMKINQDNLNNATIVDIPDALIEKINEILLPIDSQILCLKENIERLAALRDWLLPMLMNGQVRVN